MYSNYNVVKYNRNILVDLPALKAARHCYFLIFSMTASAYCTTFFCNKVRMLLTPWGRVLCISKTACFLVNCTPLSLQFGRNEEPKGSNGSHPSECDYRTPPSKSDMAPFWCAKPQPIRGFPTIEPLTFRRRQ